MYQGVHTKENMAALWVFTLSRCLSRLMTALQGEQHINSWKQFQIIAIRGSRKAEHAVVLEPGLMSRTTPALVNQNLEQILPGCEISTILKQKCVMKTYAVAVYPGPGFCRRLAIQSQQVSRQVAVE